MAQELLLFLQKSFFLAGIATDEPIKAKELTGIIPQLFSSAPLLSLIKSLAALRLAPP